MSKFSRFLHRLFRHAGRYARDTMTVTMLLDSMLARIENAEARAKLILGDDSLPDERKIVELDQLLYTTFTQLQSTAAKIRDILHDAD